MTPQAAGPPGVRTHFSQGVSEKSSTLSHSTRKVHLLRCIRLHSMEECGAHAPCICAFLANGPAFLISQIHPKIHNIRTLVKVSGPMRRPLSAGRGRATIKSEMFHSEEVKPVPIWNPWHGCHKISPGCLNCYVYRRDEAVGRDASSRR